MGSLSDNACTSYGAPLKYKWRRVSCVRDFPPGCGRNAPRINLKPQDTEAGASLGNKENLVTDEKRENGLSQPVVKSAVQDCVANGSDVANEKRVEVANGDCVEGFESGNESLSQQVMKSAVRDFPPGCGQNAPPINLKPQDTEAVASPGDELNLMADEKSVDVAKGDSVKAFESGNESPSQLLVQSALKLEVPSSLDDLVDMVVAAAGIKVELSPAVGPLGTNLPKAFGMEAPEISNEPQDPEAPAVVKSEGGMESKTVLEIGSMADGMAPACGSKAWSPLQWPISDANIGKDTTLKKKLPWRRVSAIRDFPPFCGRNAPSPTEEERRRIVLGNKTSCPPHKAAVEGELLIETVTAKEQGSPARETPRTGVEELNGDVRDRSSQKQELKGSMPELELQTGKAGKPSIEKSRADVDASPVRKTVVAAVDELNGDVRDGHAQKRKLEGSIPERSTKSQKVIGKESEDVSRVEREGGKEIAVYPLDKSFKSKSPGSAVAMGHDADRVIVQGLIAAPNCPWRQGKGVANTGVDTMMTVSEEKRRDISPVTRQEKSISAHKLKATKKVLPCGKAADKGKDQLVVRDEGAFAIQEQDGNPSARHDSSPVTGQEKSISSHKIKPMKKLLPCGKEAAEKGKGQLVVKDVGDFVIQKQDGDPSRGKRPDDFEVTLPPFGPNSSSHGDERNKVREVLRLFQAICRKLLQAEEAKLKQKGSPPRRIDLQAAQIVRDKGKEVNTAKFIIGSVPGVEVGDEFQYRVELSLVGIHRVYQGGIDYTKHGGMNIATSIVASGVYADDLDDPNVLIYSGQGGNTTGKDKQPEDQKLERGNLALKNSITTKNPVRVVRGFKETKTSKLDARAKLVAIYTYDGLYTVERYWHEVGQHGKLVFMFELRRMPDQPELAWKEVKKSNKFKIRKGLCVDDISGGKELFPICAVNTEDDELPPAFNYITEMKYPDWCCPTPRQGCDCKGGCSDSKKCSCVVMNGGEIPYNYNGAIVEAKPLVYECGPSCKCPPSCYNRVSQHGIKIQLEIFKTESRGWGVRSLTSIPSGSFICEYFGEFLEDKEAEQRQNDEYLFDIGKNYSDFSLTDGLSTEVEDGCFTIDAAQFGNVGRFINHSCSPNLYAQNVLYDHEDKKMPHIMLFAAENIPPLQELTYHYNYKVDQVRDSSGKIKVKNCYCGSAECSGRMY